MTQGFYPDQQAGLAEARRQLAPHVDKAFRDFSRAAFTDGALPARTKQIIAVAVAHVTQCPWCLRSHSRAARRAGVTEAELVEAAWVAAEMRAGASFAHMALMLDELGAGEGTGHGESVPDR